MADIADYSAELDIDLRARAAAEQKFKDLDPCANAAEGEVADNR